ncbi:MAG: hypothetical protein H7Z15_15910 [Rhizobacter sp.]|nr:hypothetical protein [Rhizobacter sp.]
MNPSVKAGRGGLGWWLPLGALALGTVPQASRAEQWLIENSLATRYESNDNAALVPSSPGTMNTLSLSSALAASRKTESSATRLDVLASSVRQWGPGEQDRVDGRLGLEQTLADPLNSFRLGAQYLQDFNNATDSADVTVARGRRRTKTLSGAWSRSLTERVSLDLETTLDRTAYGLPPPQAVDFRNDELSTGLSYRWAEFTTVSLNASHAKYRTEADTSRSTTDQISLGFSRSWSERSSLSLSLGSYRTRTVGLRSRVFCPLTIDFCNDGLPLDVATDRVYTSARGLQFNLSQRYQLDERTDLSFSAARQQAPSGAGVVVRSDTLRASASHSFSELLKASASYSQSRSTYESLEGSNVRPAQQNFSLSFSRQLAPDLSVQGGYQFSRADGVVPGQGARANSVSLSLQYDWPRFDAAR